MIDYKAAVLKRWPDAQCVWTSRGWRVITPDDEQFIELGRTVSGHVPEAVAWKAAAQHPSVAEPETPERCICGQPTAIHVPNGMLVCPSVEARLVKPEEPKEEIDLVTWVPVYVDRAICDLIPDEGHAREIARRAWAWDDEHPGYENALYRWQNEAIRQRRDLIALQAQIEMERGVD